jgi:poly(3-hydroxybutyrate) depolymerase
LPDHGSRRLYPPVRGVGSGRWGARQFPSGVHAPWGGGTGGELLIRSGWREKATQEGFVAIFPTAVEHFVLDKQRFLTHWNNYGLPVQIDPNKRPAGYPATSPWPADDVKFIRQIGDDVIQQLSTDPKRLYAAGFSSGGGMCTRLGVEASDFIAAVACHASELDQVHETLVEHRNLSAYLSMGTRDNNPPLKWSTVI